MIACGSEGYLFICRALSGLERYLEWDHMCTMQLVTPDVKHKKRHPKVGVFDTIWSEF